ncbi:MAG: protein kinase [Planctomycetaceae bacterium]|nr:protein kinase [Planctomycetaceae bacterium]
MNKPSCPAQIDLQAFSTGALSTDSAVAVARHISECPDCDSRLLLYDEECDDFLTLLRTAARSRVLSVLRETELQAAIATIAELNFETKTRPAPDLEPDASRTLAADATVAGESATEASDLPADSLWCPPGYQLLGEVARGGMGVVYRARQISADRVVALKVVRSGRPHPAELDRFLAEARAAARLHHPNIVPVYEVAASDGQPYFTMRLVQGMTLAQRLNGEPLEPRLAATILRAVADAVQFAHEHQIIHRDIKPGNILLDDTDKPYVTDFGLARVMDQASDLTTEGQIVGTPSYMPPEQALGKRDDVNETSDVYSVGAVLYFCITGRPPFQAATPVATVVQVLNQEVAAPRQLNADIPADLETICLKCLQKERLLRYESAAALAEDLRRFLSHEPIAARPAGTAEKTVKWIRRHPAWTALGVMGLISIVASAIALTSAVYNGELQNSLQQTQTAKRTTEIREQETAHALRLAEQANERAKKSEYFRQIAISANAADAGDYRTAVETFGQIDAMMGNWEFRYLQRMLHDPNSSLVVSKAVSGTLTLQIRHDGKEGVFLESGSESRFAFFDTDKAKVHRRISLGANVGGFAWIDKSLSFGTVLRFVGDHSHIERWNLESGERAQTVIGFRFDGRPVSDSAGRWSVICESGSAVRDEPGILIVDWAESSLRQFRHHGRKVATAAAFRSDGTRAYAAVANRDKEIELFEFELPEWKILQTSSLGYTARDMVLREPAEELIIVGSDRRLHRLHLDNFREILRSDAATYGFTCIELSSDGQRVIAGEQTGVVREFEIDTFRVVASHLGRRFQTIQVASAKDDRIWASGMDGHVRSWSSGRDSRFVLLRSDEDYIGTIAFSTSGKVLAAGHSALHLYDVSSQKAIAVQTAPSETVNRPGGLMFVSFLDEDRQVLTMDWGGAVRLWDGATGEHLAIFSDQEPAGIMGGCLSADQQTAYSANADHSISVWSVGERRRIHRIPVDTGQYRCAVSPNGRYLAAGGAELTKPPLVWDLTRGMESWTAASAFHPQLPAQPCWSLAFSPDGRFLAMGDVFNRVTVVDTRTWKQQWQSLTQLGVVNGLGFSPDSSRLISCSTSGRVVLFEAETGLEIMRLNGHTGAVNGVAFSPDGKKIATCGSEGVRIWPTD